MRIYALVALTFLAITPSAFAQAVPAPNSAQIAWTMQEPNAFNFQYKLYIDGTPTNLTGITCGTGGTAGTMECRAPLPAMTVGTHAIAVSAVDISDAANPAEGPRSEVLSIRFFLAPGKPANVRVIQTPAQ